MIPKSWRMTRIIMLLTTAAMLGGCGHSMAKFQVDSMEPLMMDMRDATNRNRDVELIRDAFPTILIQMDGFIQVSPDNRYLLTSAAESNIGYAFLFVEETDKPRARLLYAKGQEYAMRILKKNKAFAKALAEGDLEDFRASLKSIPGSDVAALYFATQGWMSWMNLAKADTPDIMRDLPKVEAMMDRILELDETYYHGGVHAMMGAYFASRPEMVGGNLDESRAHFKEAFEISEGRYLLWHYLFARYYAVQTKNRALFTETLDKVLSADNDILPEESFANGAAKMKARELMSHADDYFK